MTGMVTVSAKVPEDWKRRADDLGINISALTRRALEDEIKRIDLERSLEALREEARRGPRLPDGSIVRMIREMREARGFGK